MRVKPKLREDHMQDALYIFDEETGYIFELNSTAALIWDMIKEGLSEEEIFKKLREIFGEDDSKIMSDLDNFIRKLLEYHLITKE
ncbi:PqqD family protein [Candidatus Methanodesulfokora washburnensis]|nr:PqqD family protein [Candidatus Methanodesulfokores washburnensis]